MIDDTQDENMQDNSDVQSEDQNVNEENIKNIEENDDETKNIKEENNQQNDENTKVDLRELGALYDVPVQISAVLGRSTMPVHQLLKLGRGAVVELDRRVGEAIDIYVNNRLVARGEVVVVDEHLGVTMTEIIKSDRS